MREWVLSDECDPSPVSRYPILASGSEKSSPLSKSGSTGQLVGIADLEVALRRKMVVDRGMHACKILHRSHAPEPQHGALSSSERRVRVLGPVVEPTPHLAIIAATEVLEAVP